MIAKQKAEGLIGRRPYALLLVSSRIAVMLLNHFIRLFVDSH